MQRKRLPAEDILDTNAGDTVNTVLERLSAAAAWCTSRVDVADPRNCLRTTALRPHPLAGNRKAVVESVARARHCALRLLPERPDVDLSGDGRLLIYEPDINLAHGLEEDETDGYVDVNNIPPWDTWVGYLYEPTGNYLLSWVPAAFVELVSAGIHVSPEVCIQWLGTTDFELRSLLRGLPAAE